MKKIRIFTAIVLIVVLFFSFSGCSFRFANFDSLLRPPRYSGDNQELHDAFEKSVGTNYILSMPENGEYRSSFITYDFDADGDEDALVFYALREKPDAVKFRFFRHDNDKWLSSEAYDGSGNAVDSVMFSDINYDGVPEVIIGWNFLSGKANKIFSVYSTVKGQFRFIKSYPYTYLSLVDVTGDSKEDIFTLTVDSSNPEQLVGYARVYSFNSSSYSLDILSETQTDGNISTYSSIQTETVDGVKYTYIEAIKGQNDSITELLYWDDDKKALVAPFFDDTTLTTTASWRNINIASMDVDSDGMLEIPFSVEMKGSTAYDSTVSDKNITYTEDDNTNPMYFIKWVKYRNGKARPVQYSVINDRFGYMLNIPSSWVGRITVIRTDGQLDVYRWLSLEQKAGELLFSICSYDKSDAESVKLYSTYKPLGSSGNISFVYQITNSGYKFGAKEQNIEKDFILTEFGGLK